MTSIIDKIDAAMGCQQCGKPLGRSPSNDFCSESCQHGWAAKSADPPSPQPGRPEFDRRPVSSRTIDALHAAALARFAYVGRMPG